MRELSVLSLTVLLAAMLVTQANPPTPLDLAHVRVIDLTGAVAKPELDRLFKKYELLKIDQQQAAEEVLRSGRFSLANSQGAWDLVLSPYDMRAPNYHATSIGPEGLTHSLGVGPVNTFKGAVIGSNGSQVRFTIDQTHFEGLIIKDSKYYYLESAQKFSPTIEAQYFVFYQASDVIQDTPDSCAVTLGRRVNQGGYQNGPRAQTVFSPARVVELATEADYEYVSALGGAANAVNDILGIMNQVEGVYETELGIRFRIVFQHAWETDADPYPALTNDEILIEFADYWNANFTSVSRDVAHMWSGKTGGRLGLGVFEVACRYPTLAYSFSKFHDQVPYRYIIPAHEIGHNLGASHADGHAECVGTVMNPITTTSQLTFCQYSRFEIEQYVSQFGHCLTEASTYSISGQVTDINGRPVRGVTVVLSGPQPLTSETDSNGSYSFPNVPHGITYIVTSSKANYRLTPQYQTFASLDHDQSAFFTVTKSPDGPLLATEGNSNRAIALDSVTFLRDPFPTITAYNFSPDHHTRVALLAVNVLLAPSENISVVKVQAEDTLGRIYLLPVESVNQIPNIDWLTQITVRLPDEINGAGDVLVSVNLRGVISNKALMSIAP